MDASESERLPLKQASLTEDSKKFADRLFGRHPELRAYAYMERQEGSEGFHLGLEIPSPTGDDSRNVIVWMDEGTEPSLAFGPFHTHADVWVYSDGLREGDLPPTEAPDDEVNAFIGLLEAILSDEFVRARRLGGGVRRRLGRP